jgi:hypothetical protein
MIIAYPIEAIVNEQNAEYNEHAEDAQPKDVASFEEDQFHVFAIPSRLVIEIRVKYIRFTKTQFLFHDSLFHYASKTKFTSKFNKFMFENKNKILKREFNFSFFLLLNM